MENALLGIPYRIGGTRLGSARAKITVEEIEGKRCVNSLVFGAALCLGESKEVDPSGTHGKSRRSMRLHKTRYRRITIHLQRKQGLRINHKAVLRLMSKLGIRSQARKPKMYKKLAEIGTYHRYPNVLNRDFVATKPNQKWVTDVTYIRTVQGWAYLSTIKDLYDGFIVACLLTKQFDPW
jgi:transposase InsO family protein